MKKITNQFDVFLRNSIYLFISFAMIIVSCSKQNQLIPSPEINQGDVQIQKSYSSVIQSLGFNPDSAIDIGDCFIVSGDILLSKTALDSLMKVNNPIRQATANLLNRTTVGNITVYIDPSIPTSGPYNWRPEIEAAMNHWNGLSDSHVTFNLLSTPNADIVVKSDGGSLSNNTVAAAEFPTGYNDPGYQIRINMDYSATSSQKVYNMVHEFGHCIGFRHTNWHALNEPTGNEIYHGVPDSDPYSIMNGGTGGNSWSGFSNYDVLAASLIYPEWADYTLLGSGAPAWTNTEAMTSLNGFIYAVQNSRFYKIDPNNGSYVQLGGAVWPGTEAMTSLNGFIYLVENSRLYKVNPNDGSYVQLGGAVWAGTNAMTSLNGYIYLVENSRLYRVNPTDGSYVQLGGAVWANTEAMCTYNNYIYQVQNSRLYQVNPNDGSYVQLGGAVWTATKGMSVVGNNLYIVEYHLYYKVSPINGSYTRLGGIAWTLTDAMTSMGSYNYIVDNGRLYKVNSN